LTFRNYVTSSGGKSQRSSLKPTSVQGQDQGGGKKTRERIQRILPGGKNG